MLVLHDARSDAKGNCNHRTPAMSAPSLSLSRLSMAEHARAWDFSAPRRVIASLDGLVIETAGKTDFWQRTVYGFRRDNGHFCPVATLPGDATAEVQVGFAGEYRDLYDQAGLMLRFDADHWVKAGVEFVDGHRQASVVVTRRGFSDWSVVPLPTTTLPITDVPGSPLFALKLRREPGAVCVYFADGVAATDLPDAEGGRVAWRLMRVADFPTPTTTIAATDATAAASSVSFSVGPMCCSPTGEGFSVRFAQLSVQSPAPRAALHGDTFADDDHHATTTTTTTSEEANPLAAVSILDSDRGDADAASADASVDAAVRGLVQLRSA